MTSFTPIASALGGALIGLAASVLLAGSGKIAGISGIFGGALVPKTGDTSWRVTFLAGFLLAGFALSFAAPQSFGAPVTTSVAVAVLAGALVGAGTQIGNGCTSGHGVCGLSRFSIRSFTATLVFMVAAMITVFIWRRLGGGS